MQERMFYIENIGSYAWDYVLWWKPNRSGYTYDIREAGLYTSEEAIEICKVRGEERAWAQQDVLAGIEHAVSLEKLHRHGYAAAYEPTKQQRAQREKGKKPNFVHCQSDSCKAYRRLSEARGKLLGHFRLGTPPSEQVFKTIESAQKVIDKAEEERKLQEGR